MVKIFSSFTIIIKILFGINHNIGYASLFMRILVCHFITQIQSLLLIEIFYSLVLSVVRENPKTSPKYVDTNGKKCIIG